MTYSFHVFDELEDFKGVFNPDKTKSKIRFKDEVGIGSKEMNVEFSYPWDDFPRDTIREYRFVRVFESTKDYPLGNLIFSGWISQVSPYIKDATEGVKISVFGLSSLLKKVYYKDGASLKVVKTNEDPADIVRDIIASWQNDYPSGSYEWIGTDAVPGVREGNQIEDTGKSVSFDFDNMYCIDALRKCVELAGGDYFFKIDQGGDVIFKKKPATPVHDFIIGKHIQTLDATNSIEEVINRVWVKHKTGTVTDEDTTSIDEFGLSERFYLESEASADAATEIAAQKIAENKESKTNATFLINNSYDLSTVMAGDSCSLSNYKLDFDLFGANMFIVAIQREEEVARIYLEQQELDLSKSLANFITNTP